MKIRYLIAMLLFLTILSAAFTPVKAVSFDSELNAKYAVLYNLENDQILFEKEIDAAVYPASTVKIMTAVLALEYYEGRLDTPITVKPEAIKNISGNNIALSAGETFRAEQLIGALIVGNANDAAVTLAFEIGGSVEEFADRMNQKAAEMGMTHTVFKNPTGMHHKNMVSTVSDILILAKYAFNMPQFMRFSSLPKYEIGEGANRRVIHNRNYLVSSTLTSEYYYAPAKGMNAGSTYESGACLVTAASEKNLNYICIVMGCQYDSEKNQVLSYSDAKTLLKFALENYVYTRVIDSKDIVKELPVALGKDVDYVSAVPDKSCDVLLNKGINISDDIQYSVTLNQEELTAPVQAGDILGSVEAYYQGKKLASANLIAKSSIEKSAVLTALHNLKQAVNQPIVYIISGLIVLIVLYAIAASLYRKRNKNRKSRYLK